MTIEIVVNNDKPATTPASNVIPLIPAKSLKAPKPRTKPQARTPKRALSAEVAEAGEALDRLYTAVQRMGDKDAANWQNRLGVVFAAILQAADDATATAGAEGGLLND